MKLVINTPTTFLVTVLLVMNLSALPNANAQLNVGTLPPVISLLLSDNLPAGIVAFAWADDVSMASYSPDYSYNSAGGSIDATRSSAGTYKMMFNGLSLSRGNVQVSAYDSGHTCGLDEGGWGVSHAEVHCFDSSGALADSRYTISVIQDTISEPDLTESDAFIAGYVFASSPSSANYSPNSFYSYNSTGGTSSISRSSTGDYSVTMFGVNTSSTSNALVSAYGSNANCYSDGWGLEVFDVVCVDPAGINVDSEFSILVTEADGRPKMGSARVAAYVWAGSESTSSYQADTGYSYANGPNANITITRNGTGDYTVDFNKAISNDTIPFGGGGNVQVTSYGANTNCTISIWVNATAGVTCFDSAGAAADSKFSLAYYVK